MWANLKTRTSYKDTKGFTIVELLIVVVVIGILAAITVVAYTGINRQAASSASQSSANQASKKLLTYALEHGEEYPATLAAAGIANSGSTTFQYSVNNSSTPKTFCVTATTKAESYWVSNSKTNPTSGGCAGHGVGGVAAVTNYHKNPFFVGSAGPVNGTNSTDLGIVDISGVKYAQGTLTANGASAIRLMANVDRWAISAGQEVFSRVTIRNPNASSRSFSIILRFYDTAGASTGGLLTPTPPASSGTVVLAAGASSVFTVSGVAPADTASVTIDAMRNSNSAAINDVIQATGVWLGSVDAAPASGATQNWVWNGVANESTSTGPPQQ